MTATVSTRAALALCLALIFSALSGSAQEERTVRIAVEGAFPPFNYIDQGELQGFEVDLGKALCAAIPARCVFVQHDWDGIVKGLLNREYDAIMSSLHITDRRKKRVLFSQPYYRIPWSFITAKDAPASEVGPAALAAKSIGVIEGSPEAAFLEAKYASSQIKRYAQLEDADLDLLTARIDFVLGDKLALSRFLESREGAECCRLAGDAAYDPAYANAGAGIGLRLEDGSLKDAFDRALGAVMADGTYERIRAKYFPFDVKPSP